MRSTRYMVCILTRGLQSAWAGEWIGFGPAVAGAQAFKTRRMKAKQLTHQ